jgi:hypothetical protein
MREALLIDGCGSTMDTGFLCETFPRIFHMAHVDAWEGIRRHGLLSTSALLDRFEITGDERRAIESARRRTSVIITHPVHGRAVIRDNIPLDDSGLQRSLTDMSPVQWYELLNRKVFFWLTEERLMTLLEARAYRDAKHCVITIDTTRLLANCIDRVWLSPMNSGATRPVAHKRGTDTFRRVEHYSFDHWRKKRSSSKKAIAELAVDYSVPNLMECVEEVTIRERNRTLVELFKR